MWLWSEQIGKMSIKLMFFLYDVMVSENDIPEARVQFRFRVVEPELKLQIPAPGIQKFWLQL